MSRWGAHSFAQNIHIAHPGRFAPATIWLIRHAVDPLVRLFHRPTLIGVDNLPVDQPFVLVANHSAGMAVAEILSFAAVYLRNVGADRPLAGVALPLSFKVFPLSKVLGSVGAIPSTYDAAQDALSKGVPILIFPGGDHESLRPLWQAHRVDFAGRLGFLKIARKARVPIVPMGIRGSHFTAPILFRSRLLPYLLIQPRLIGQKRWAISLLGLLGAVAIGVWLPVSVPWRLALGWLLLGSPLSFLPWIPATIRMKVGPPIAPDELFADDPEAQTEQELHAALQRVQSSVQALVSEKD